MHLSRWVLAVLALILLLALLFPERIPIPLVSDVLRALRPKQEQECPDFSAALPSEWQVVVNRQEETDGDEEKECVLIYRYDSRPEKVGPLGGVVYDLQPERAPASLETPVAYRPAAYVPYQLLPRPGGQGYLGETKVEIAVYNANGGGRNDVVVLGYAGYDFPVFLSIFEWVDKVRGYRSLIGPYYAHPEAPMIFADAGITIKYEQPAISGEAVQGKITQVLARRRIYDPPHYARSQLARQTIYEWGAGGILRPQPDESIVFAFGRPEQAQDAGKSEYALMYPEAAVLAYYRDGEVLEIYAPQENLDLPQAPVLVRVKVKRGETQAIETWAVRRHSEGRVGEPVKWKLEKQ